jgi:hypothetical protein
MNTIHEVEKAIQHFSQKELINFRAWFDEYEAKNWDDQFESDVKAGKLDKFADQALADFMSDKCKKL